MENAYYFSDESGTHSGGRYFIVAGIALINFRAWVKTDLEHAERASGKGKQDWKGTKNAQVRSDYIRRMLDIERLHGAAFYAEYCNNDKDYWAYTVDALESAIKRFSPDKKNLVRHQGLNYRSREKLRRDLRACGIAVEIQSGSEKRAEIRAADGLAGYLGLMRHNSDNDSCGYYCKVPSWIIDLKNEAPTTGSS